MKTFPTFLLSLIFARACLLYDPVWGATNPTLPQSVPPGTRPTPTGSMINVHSGDDLQAIYNAASCGQDLVLDEGAVFTGNYVFNKPCSAPDWILVEGAGCANGTVKIPTYVTQASANYVGVPPWRAPDLSHYATLTTGIGVSPLVTTDSNNNPGRYNYFGCLEVTSSVAQYALVGTTNALFEKVSSQLGDHFIFDRMYVHGHHSEPTAQMLRGFLLAGSNDSVVNSYVSDIYGWGDSQAIAIAMGPGPTYIHNNYLSASTEIIMAGGTGKTPGYSCTIAADPAPTSMSATVNACVDAAGGAMPAPSVGTEVMFYASAGIPYYVPGDATTITGNNAGALTFNAILDTPLTGTGMIAWGLRPNDTTITQEYFWKDPCWNAANPCYDRIAPVISRTSWNQRVRPTLEYPAAIYSFNSWGMPDKPRPSILTAPIRMGMGVAPGVFQATSA